MSTRFEQALANCSKEPIHIPGAIQPFGVLFALDEELRVTHCSENVATLLGGGSAEAVLGCSIEEVLQCDLGSLVKAGDFDSGEPVRLPASNTVETWYAFLHRRHGRLILELEATPTVTGADEGLALGSWVRASLASFDSSVSVSALCLEACEQVKQVTGLDGVMVYKFHDDGHGEVIAEAKDEEWPKYLGQHYPASDIPSQARAVFLENWLRMIPDRDYSPVRLISNDAGAIPLDLGRSLCAVCPRFTSSISRTWVCGHHSLCRSSAKGVCGA